MQWPEPGYNHTPAYQASGLPFAIMGTATTTPPYRLQFPYVTKFITVRADGGTLRVGFTANGVINTNHFEIENNDIVTFEVRVKEIYLYGSNGFHVLAGLTGIPTASVPTLTGSYAWAASDPYHTGSNAFANIIAYEGLG